MLTIILLAFSGFYFMFISRFTSAKSTLDKFLFNVLTQILGIALVLYAAYLVRFL